jgi:ribonucleotide reductase alpha subunit
MPDGIEPNDWTIDVPWHDFRVEVDRYAVDPARRLVVEPDGVISVRDFGSTLAVARVESGSLTCFSEVNDRAYTWTEGSVHPVSGRCWWRNDSGERAVLLLDRADTAHS